MPDSTITTQCAIAGGGRYDNLVKLISGGKVNLPALGFGLGPMYPVSTIVMQNVVKPHQLGTATGTLNFFRTLGGALVVAIFGAIVLGGIGDGPGVTTLEKIAAGHSDLAPAFHWVFIAAAICLAISLLCLLVIEERPLHGPTHVANRVAE